MKKALLMVDLQNDFMPGGALPVPNGNQIIPLANAIQSHFKIIIATQDWHPRNHSSFALNHPGHQVGEVITVEGLPQILWPVHCVQNTPGAALVNGLDVSHVAHIVHKGTDPAIDSYSSFFDNYHRKSTGLTEYLRDLGVTHLYILGVATEYCVKFTALDACQFGFHTFVIEDACCGIELLPGDITKAKMEMEEAGTSFIQLKDVASNLSAG